MINVKPNSEVDTLKGEVLYDDGTHKFIWLGWEEKEEEELVHVNQFLVMDQDEGAVLDPGGIHVFPRIVGNISRYIEVDRLKHLFFTHQDPDVCSGIAMWLSITPAKVYISKWWVRFLPHFGIFDSKRLVPIEDKGGRIQFRSGRYLEIIPAHFLHSTANFTLYDPISKILFTGDLGTALFEKGKKYLFVENFNSHVKLMEVFHRRFMTSNIAIKHYLDRISKYEIDAIVTQHGAIFVGEDCQRFFSWLRGLRCGIDAIKEIYG